MNKPSQFYRDTYSDRSGSSSPDSEIDPFSGIFTNEIFLFYTSLLYDYYVNKTKLKNENKKGNG